MRRRPDPRIAAAIVKALADARTVLNVGAGAGSYEPDDRHVAAVEPAAVMRAQRPPERVPAIDAVAENLPFDDASFDATMAVLTIHQWSDLEAGLRELRRVSRGPVVILSFDAPALNDFWLREYLPQVIAIEQRRFPRIRRVLDGLGGTGDVVSVPVPRDCTDGFGEAYYACPEAFLDPDVRAAQSGWVLADADDVRRGVDRLADDLTAGAWDRRHGHLRSLTERHGAVRLITARP